MSSTRPLSLRTLSLGSFALVAVLSSGCFAWNGVRGSGKVAKESRDVKSFDRVSASSGINLDLRVGPQTAIVIEADDNILALVETKVSGGELEIRFAEHNLSTESDVVVHIQVPALTEVSVSGGSKARGEVASVDSLELNASGGGEIRLRGVATRRLEADASGGSRLDLEGRAEAMKVELSGGAGLRASRLATARVQIDEGSGGCAAQVRASESVKGDLSGGCALDVQGAAKVKVSASGGSSVGHDDD